MPIVPASGVAAESGIVPARKIGAQDWLKKYPGSGSTSKMAKPPRTAVFPLPLGSQAKPNRGSKLRRVGFEKIGATPAQPGFPSATLVAEGADVPQVGNGSVMLARLVSLPVRSLITVFIS